MKDDQVERDVCHSFGHSYETIGHNVMVSPEDKRYVVFCAKCGRVETLDVPVKVNA